MIGKVSDLRKKSILMPFTADRNTKPKDFVLICNDGSKILVAEIKELNSVFI